MRMDMTMVRDLENFAALKRKHEIYRQTVESYKVQARACCLN